MYQGHRRPRSPNPSTRRSTRAAARKETRDADASRKRVAPDEGADQATKRRKTQGEASVPLRTSQRLRKSGSGDVPHVEAVKEAAGVVCVHSVEAEFEVDVEMVEDEPPQAKAPMGAVPSTKKAARRKRAWAPKKRARRPATGKAKATPKNTVQEAETPAASSQITVPIAPSTEEQPAISPSTFVLPPLIIGDAESAPSPTAVGSPDSLDSTTRVGTPTEPSDKPVEIKLAEAVVAKLQGIAPGPTAKVPVRASARIRERKTGATGTRV
ncbi:hypothetical protein C8Q80DRAFT_620462 [Daedaleopsis nitida]|nr:hypothetical protein C8Q80DRAFT_620462 [Daedaleopsis nitida]